MAQSLGRSSAGGSSQPQLQTSCPGNVSHAFSAAKKCRNAIRDARCDHCALITILTSSSCHGRCWLTTCCQLMHPAAAGQPAQQRRHAARINPDSSFHLVCCAVADDGPCKCHVHPNTVSSLLGSDPASLRASWGLSTKVYVGYCSLPGTTCAGQRSGGGEAKWNHSHQEFKSYR